MNNSSNPLQLPLPLSALHRPLPEPADLSGGGHVHLCEGPARTRQLVQALQGAYNNIMYVCTVEPVLTAT